jgi:hypothetical protein
MMQVDDATFVEIKVGEQDLPGQPDFFEEICIIENVAQLVPTLSFKLNDGANHTVKSFHLSDGLPIDIRISNDPTSDNKLSRFRIFNGDTSRVTNSGHVNFFNCTLDVPKYIGSVAGEGLKGTISDVLK